MLANESAFELIAKASGAALLWAPRERNSAALLALALAPDGTAAGAPTALVEPSAAPGELSDLSAIFAGDELTAAWVERSAKRARLRAVVQTAGVEPRLLELGAAWFAPSPARGNLAVAAQGKAALVFARGEATACVDGKSEQCFSFTMQKLEQGRANSRGFPLIVPTPCAETSLAFTVTGRDLHYAVCARANQEPLTTLFTIRAQPEYARADPVLPGCRPLALLALGGSVRLVADCGGERRSAHVGPDNSAVTVEELPSPDLDCQGARPRIRFGESWVELDAPSVNLQALLPSVVAPRGSRAVFTGRALLVAAAKGGKVTLTRYACQAGILRQLADPEW